MNFNDALCRQLLRSNYKTMLFELIRYQFNSIGISLKLLTVQIPFQIIEFQLNLNLINVF